MLPRIQLWRCWSAVVVSMACAHSASAPVTLAPARDGLVESRWENGHVFVRLWHGNRPLWLLLDSGASNTMLTTGVLADMGIHPLGEAVMDGSARRFSVRAFSGALLQVDSSLSIAVPTLYELPSGIPALEGMRGVDGIAGFELFSQARVLIDPTRRLVRVLPLSDSAADGADDVVFELERRLPIIEAELWFMDGTTVRAPFILDLGSNAEVHLNQTFAAHYGLASRLANREQSLHSGLWTNERGVEGRALVLKIGRALVRTPTVFVGEDSIGALADAGIAGTIGLGVLQQFRMGLDYRARRVSMHHIVAFASRDTSHRCVVSAPPPRQPVVMRVRPFTAVIAAAGPPPADSTCEMR